MLQSLTLHIFLYVCFPTEQNSWKGPTTTKSQSTLLRALSKCLLNTDRFGTSTTSLVSLLQTYSRPPLGKDMFPNTISGPPLMQLWTSFPGHISLDPREKCSVPSSLLSLLRTLQRAMRSSLSFLFWKPDSPKVLIQSSEELPHFWVEFEKGVVFCICISQTPATCM